MVFEIGICVLGVTVAECVTDAQQYTTSMHFN